MQKGKIFFNIIIIIVTIALISAMGYAAYYYISKYKTVKEAEEVVEEFENEVIVVALDENMENLEQPQNQEPDSKTTIQMPNQSTTTNTRKTITYKGYNVIGTIQIPKTKVKAPIVDKISPTSIAAAVAFLYGPNMQNPTLNEVGNTVLAAHNYRNGTFFSNNKNLVVGDKVYITDQSGQKIEYTIYKTYITTDSDFDYAIRNTNRKT